MEPTEEFWRAAGVALILLAFFSPIIAMIIFDR